MISTSRLAFFGSLTIDDLVFADGTTRWGVPGGNVVYAALGAALWTPRPNVVAPLGPDYPIELIENKLNLARCPAAPHTLRNWGLYEEDGRRHFVSRASSRNWGEFCPRPKDARSGHQIAAHVAAMPRRVAIELIKELRDEGARTISLDLDDHDLLSDTSHAESVELIRSVDLFLPSRQDAFAIVHEMQPIESLIRLRSLAPDLPLIAVKCGPEGIVAHALKSNQWVHIPVVQVPVIDTTGAGDAFCGGVLAGITEHGDPVESLLYGAVSASFCIETIGFAGLIAATEAEARLRLTMLRRKIDRGALPGVAN